MIKQALLTTLIATLAWDAAVADSGSSTFWERKHEGWFFYNEPPPEPEKEEVPPPPLPPPAPTQTETIAPPEVATLPTEMAPPAPPATFSSEWFRENLPKYRDIAWDDPTIENVRAYLYLQRFAMDRSSQFADVSQLAVVGDPWLDETVRRPAATFASQDLDKQAGRARNQVLDALAERVGIFFFYASDCEMCATQAPVMKMLENQFVMTPISLDGHDLPGNPFPNYRTDAGHAEMLGVERLPAIYLASPEGDFVPIAQGGIALNELRERLIIAARRSGWVTDAEYNSTRPILNLEDNLSELLPFQSLHNQDAVEEDGFIPPAELLQFIERSTQGY